MKGRSADSDFSYKAPLKTVEIITVNIDVLRGAPTMRVHISGSEGEFIIDLGSSVSLIQPGVSINEVKATSVLRIVVTGDAFKIQGEQNL
jgi:hypothetical protein